MNPLMVAMFLSVVNERLVEALISPIFEKFKLDTFYLLYIAWVTGAGIVFLSGVNLFIDFIPNQVAGQVLTAIVAGGGSNLLHILFSAVDRTTRK